MKTEIAINGSNNYLTNANEDEDNEKNITYLCSKVDVYLSNNTATGFKNQSQVKSMSYLVISFLIIVFLLFLYCHLFSQIGKAISG